MYLDAAKKQEIFGKYGKSNTDTGSAEAQIALFSYRIAHLTEHMKLNRKDYSTERALTMLVGKRRALLNYLKDRDINRYRAIVQELGLRKKFTCGKLIKAAVFSNENTAALLLSLSSLYRGFKSLLQLYLIEYVLFQQMPVGHCRVHKILFKFHPYLLHHPLRTFIGQRSKSPDHRKRKILLSISQT